LPEFFDRIAGVLFAKALDICGVFAIGIHDTAGTARPTGGAAQNRRAGCARRLRSLSGTLTVSRFRTFILAIGITVANKSNWQRGAL